MQIPLPELAPGNVVRIKSTGQCGFVISHHPPDQSGFYFVNLYIWDSAGQLQMDGQVPELFLIRADELVILTIGGYDVPYADGFDLHPPCPYCGGYGYTPPVRLCRQCKGWGRSRIVRRIHPELLAT